VAISTLIAISFLLKPDRKPIGPDIVTPTE